MNALYDNNKTYYQLYTHHYRECSTDCITTLNSESLLSAVKFYFKDDCYYQECEVLEVHLIDCDKIHTKAIDITYLDEFNYTEQITFILNKVTLF